MSASSNFTLKSVCLVVMAVTLFGNPSLAEAPDESVALAKFKSIRGELDPAQSKEFLNLLGSTHLLERPKLERGTIDDVGQIIERTHGDQKRQMDFLDGFGGLWVRVGIDVDPLGFANLEDRIARKQGAPQAFGTLQRGPADYPEGDAQRIYAAARDMIGIRRGATVKSVDGVIRLSMTNPSYPTLPEVRAELLRLGSLDQQARQEPREGFKDDQEKAFVKRMTDTDAYTLPRIRAIFDRYGIPAPQQVGRSGTHAAFLLIQHAINDPALMRGALASAKRLTNSGDLPSVDYALLSDRVDCFLDHRPQRFGTQGNRDHKSFWYCPIEDPEHANQRRADINLPPLSRAQIYGPDNARQGQ